VIYLVSPCISLAAGMMRGWAASVPEPIGVAGWRAALRMGWPLVDSYLAFVAGRARPNT